jgi:predicted RNA-binding protein with TRAM domain
MATSNNNNVNMLSVNAIQNEINTSSVDSGKVSTPDDPSVSGHSGIANVNDTTVFVDDAEVMIRDGSAISHVKDSIISLNDTQLLFSKYY